MPSVLSGCVMLASSSLRLVIRNHTGADDQSQEPWRRRPPRYVAAVAKHVDPGDLVGAREIADRLGIAGNSVVYDWMRRYDDFPRPVARLSAGNIWLWSEVAAWARRTGRPR